MADSEDNIFIYVSHGFLGEAQNFLFTPRRMKIGIEYERLKQPRGSKRRKGDWSESLLIQSVHKKRWFVEPSVHDIHISFKIKEGS